jgi:hypothetical protein
MISAFARNPPHENEALSDGPKQVCRTTLKSAPAWSIRRYLHWSRFVRDQTNSGPIGLLAGRDAAGHDTVPLSSSGRGHLCEPDHGRPNPVREFVRDALFERLVLGNVAVTSNRKAKETNQ